MHTGITTLFVAALLFRLYCKRMHAKARIESGYKCIIESTKDTESIKGSLNGSYKNYGSINGSVQELESSVDSIQSTHFNTTVLQNKYEDEDKDD